MTAPASQIIAEVAQAHGISVREMRSATRQRVIAWARQEAMWRMRRETKASYQTIARLLGLADHTTARHGALAHQARLEVNCPSDDDPLGFWPCVNFPA